MGIEFALQVSGSAFGHDVDGLMEGCRRAEALGFAEIRVADHPGTSLDPFVVLTAVAGATSTIRIGTYVLNMGVRHPLDVAIAATTLDTVSGGRLTLGIGAGHTPQEWEARGTARPSATDRVGRLVEAAAVLPPLLAGETVVHRAEYLDLDRAIVEQPSAVQTPIPLLVGGNNRRILDLAGSRADIVGLAGLGRTLPDGHTHTVAWSPGATQRTVDRVLRAAAGRSTPPVLDALVQVVDAGADREAKAAELAAEVEGLEPDHALDCPYVLLGSPEEIAAQVTDNERRWGITSYTVRPAATDHIGAVIALLDT